MNPMIRFALTSTLMSMAFVGSIRAENSQSASNLSFKPSSVGLEITRSFLTPREVHKEKIATLAFQYEVSSPRDQASGQASGKRMHGSLSVRPLNPQISDQIAAALAKNDIQDAQKKLKFYLVSLSHVPHPVDVNAEIYAIVDKAFLRKDPELKHRLDTFAEAIGDLESNRVKIEKLSSQLADCRQSDPQSDLTLNLCDGNLLQEITGQISQLQSESTSLKELAGEEQLKLQQAIDSRQQMMEILSDILKKMEDTSDSVAGNIK